MFPAYKFALGVKETETFASEEAMGKYHHGSGAHVVHTAAPDYKEFAFEPHRTLLKIFAGQLCHSRALQRFMGC
jgi:hypothetical protein